MTINFNVDPYFDDYNEDDKYLRVLFRPGYPVQARELTQLQSILQNQVERFGRHVFKQGSMVIPGQTSYDGEFHYVKLQTVYNNIEVDTYVDEFLGQQIVGSTTGVRAQVIHVERATSTDPATLYVKYLAAGTDNVVKIFADNEEIVSQDNTNQRYAYAYTQNATGLGSACSVEKGVYFVNGFFTQVDRQTIILDRYTNTPTYRVGLFITEDVITPEEDENLFDNAQGSTNFAAPGAHRYRVNLTLEKRTQDTDEDQNFVELLRVASGEVQYQVKSSEYADIMETMARRTYDESGDYTVRAFGIDVREHRNNDRGDWQPNTNYLIGDVVQNTSGAYFYARSSGISTTNMPVHNIGVSSDGGSIYWEYTEKPPFNRGVYAPEQGGDESKLAMGLERGKAYVRGYEIEKLATTFVTVPKARSFNNIIDGKVSTPVGSFMQVTNLFGIPNLETLPLVQLRDALTVVSGTGAGNVVGTARVRGIELESGANGSITAIYKVSLFDILMHMGVTSVEITNSGSGYTSAPTVAFSEPFTAAQWSSGGAVTVGSYVKNTVSGVTYYWKVIDGTTLGTVAPSQTVQNETETQSNGTVLEFVGIRAMGTAQVSGGFLAAIQITNPGHGYAVPPTITLTGGGGSGATTLPISGNLDFTKLVKQIYTTNTNIPFVSDSYSTDLKGVGVITCAGAGATALVSGNGTQFTLQVKPGDIVSTSDGRSFKVGYVANDTTLYATVNVTNGFSDRAFVIKSAPLFEGNNTSLLYRLPYNSIRRIRSTDDATIGTTTTVRQLFAQQTVPASLELNFTTDTVDETFPTPDTPATTDRNFLLVKVSGGGSASIGTVVAPTSITYTDTTQRNIKVVVPSSFYSTTGANVRLIATVNKTQSAAKEKTKTLVFNETLNITDPDIARAQTINLGKADVYRIVKIFQSTVPFGQPYDPAAVIDVTDYYTMDNGQRDTHYDIGTITIKPGFITSAGLANINGPLRIVFEYFQHTGTGDYFCVDSYSGIAYNQIPTYKGIRLSDVIDFRPRINDDGKTFSNAPSLPKRTLDMFADYSYYVARKGSLALLKTGQMVSKEGIPSLTPTLPEAPADGMILYNVSYMPYTFDTSNKEVIIYPVENRRYTMRDIGNLESRIEKLEEFTKLSLLERATASTQIIDSTTLADRLKAGFIVDTFDGHSIGDTTAIDYRVAIDTISREMRPLYNIENINLVEKNSTTAQRTAANYIINGDVVTLPYDHKVFVQQPYASRTENVNPFAIFTFIGQIDLNPASDEWVDIENVDVTIYDEREKASLENIAKNTYNPYTGKMGVLGSYYGAWQQVATGVTEWQRKGGQYTQTDSNWWQNGRSGYRREVHDEVLARQMQNQRMEYETSIKLIGDGPKTLTEDKITSSTVIPYIRSRPLLFVGKGIKPNSKVNAYFDGTDVTKYVSPAMQMVITNRTGSFDSNSNVGSASQETARQGSVDGKTALAYNRGDVIYVSSRAGTSYTVDNSPATAVVCLVEDNTTVLRLTNVKGTFNASDVILGTVSGARASVVSAVAQTSLVTNDNGEVAGVFTIPNTDQLRFRCGSRTFRLSDALTDFASTTRAEKTYLASGVKETHSRTFSSVRHYEISTRELGFQVDGNSKTWIQDPTTSRTVADTNWYDPLAQTFLVQNPGGAMITKVDVYFATKDPTIPVRIQIRETDNGYPSKVIVPFSEVSLNPSQVFVSANGSVPTTFHFPTPIHLRDKGEYALVVMSDSNKYTMWISQMGEKEIQSGRFISEQPYMGVLFKSQNGSTWTAEQMQDMKFTLYRAKFDTNVVAEVDLVNDILPTQDLKDNPFETTTGSGTIIVTHHSHGLPTGSYVRLTVPDGTYHGISASLLNQTHRVTRVDYTKYSITVNGTATATGLTGGGSVKATRNVQFNQIHPQIEELLLPDTNIEYEIQAVSGKSLDGAEVAYQFDQEFVDVIPNQSNFFESPRLVASQINENVNLQGTKSMVLRARLSTSNDAVTPMLDLHRTSALVIENIINNQDESNIIYVDEEEPHTGTAAAKYMTKKVKLVNPGTGLYVSFDANVPQASTVNVYYKIGKAAESLLFELKPWQIMVPDAGQINKTDDLNNFIEQIFSEETLEEFDTVQIKIVLKSTNSSAIPRVQNLRVIALS
jgi:Domain of unknown function (DUF4815)